MKWIKLIKFIKYHRKRGEGSFRVTTNSDTFIIYVGRTTLDTDGAYERDQLRLKYH